MRRGWIREKTPRPVRLALGRAGAYFVRGLEEGAIYPSIDATLRTLGRLGFVSRFCVDIGAYNGDWTRLFREIFPESGVLMIEAQEARRGALEKVAARSEPGLDVEIALLGPRRAERILFHEMESGSSVFEEASPYSRTAIEKSAQTLDGLLREKSCPRVDFIKLDVQGYELEVLNGGSRAMSQAEAILLETSLLPINRGCPLFAEVIAFFHKLGFRLFDFCGQIRRKDGVLWQTDLLFLRRDSKYAPEAKLTTENWG